MREGAEELRLLTTEPRAPFIFQASEAETWRLCFLKSRNHLLHFYWQKERAKVPSLALCSVVYSYPIFLDRPNFAGSDSRESGERHNTLELALEVEANGQPIA